MSKVSMPPHGNRRYPWEKWTDGKPHRAAKGKHFDVSPVNFAQAVLKHAKSRGLKATTRVKGEDVIFQFDGRRAKSSKR